MWYIEYLRARRALTVYGIIIAAIVVLATIVRLNVHVHPSSGPIHSSLDSLGIMAALMIAVLGTVLATSLSSHVNGHLEIAWTKPIPRDRLIAQTFLIDIGALALAYVTTIAVFVVLNAIYSAHVDVSLVQLGHVAAEFLFPVALYGLVQGVTSASGRRGGMIAGISWPVFLGLSGALSLNLPDLTHRAVVALNVLNPLALLSAHVTTHQSLNALGMPSWSPTAVAEAMLILAVGLALAIVQWRRLEI